MLLKVKAYIQRHNMLHHGDRVVVGVSGGADSMALLACLDALKDELGLRLFVAHVNHGLRGKQSDEDATFVARQAGRLKLPFCLKQLDPGFLHARKGQSLEDAARTARYDFLRELLSELPADKIAVGHQLHDQAETVLLNLLRGTGAAGLGGIRPVREEILVRPLLEMRKEEIQQFLNERAVPYRDDESNQSTVFWRNRMRHELLPQLQNYNRHIEEHLCRLAHIMRLESDFWEGQVRQVCSLWGITADAERLTLPVKAFRDLHEALQRRLVKFLLESRSAGKNGIHQIHIEQILQLIREGRSGTKISLPFRTEAVHYYDHIIIRPESRETLARHQGSSNLRLPREPAVVNPQQVVETIPADIKMEETGLCLRMTLTDPPEKGYSAHAAYIDFYRIKFPLLVRTMLPGDRFHPLGLQGTKKLKTFYIDRKIPREIRGRIPLLVDQVGILWIGGMTISEDVKVTPLTRACLKIEII